MYLTDYHIHTDYSFDGDHESLNTVDAVCAKAIEMGLSEIAFTEHNCVNLVEDGEWPPSDFASEYIDVLAAKDKYAGKLRILFGVELGQPAQRSDTALEFLSKYKFEYIIGSLHNNRNTLDPYYIDYENTPENELIRIWDNYFVETIEHIKWGKGRFCTLGHLTYPRRYYVRHGFGHLIDIEAKREIIDEIFRLLIEYGISFEVNTSGLRQGLFDTIPCKSLVERYLELGGEMITVGSDAHYLKDCGAGVKETVEMLRGLGLKYLTVFRDLKPEMVKID